MNAPTTFCPKQHDAQMAVYLGCTPTECGLKTVSTAVMYGTRCLTCGAAHGLTDNCTSR